MSPLLPVLNLLKTVSALCPLSYFYFLLQHCLSFLLLQFLLAVIQTLFVYNAVVVFLVPTFRSALFIRIFGEPWCCLFL